MLHAYVPAHTKPIIGISCTDEDDDDCHVDARAGVIWGLWLVVDDPLAGCDARPSLAHSPLVFAVVNTHAHAHAAAAAAARAATAASAEQVSISIWALSRVRVDSSGPGKRTRRVFQSSVGTEPGNNLNTPPLRKRNEITINVAQPEPQNRVYYVEQRKVFKRKKTQE